MNLEKLITIFTSQGIRLEDIRVIKNGVECVGIRIINPETPGISPVIYYSAQDTMEEIAARIQAALESGMSNFDTDILSDPEYLFGNSYLAVQRKSNDDCLKKDCLNLDVYIRILVPVDDHQFGSVKADETLLVLAGITEEDLWEAAIANSLASYTIRSMGSILGLPEEENAFMYVLTADPSNEGAAALYCPELFRQFCLDHQDSSCYIIPSSTQELILIPAKKAGSIDASILCNMTLEINHNYVDPVIQLDPVSYRYNLASNAITIAARADGR